MLGSKSGNLEHQRDATSGELTPGDFVWVGRGGACLYLCV